MLSTMSLDSLFLSLLISRPVAEKIRSDGMDVEGHAWQSLRFRVFNSFFFHHSKGSQSCDGLCYHVIKLQNCLFCCGVANIIVYLRRVNNLKTDVYSNENTPVAIIAYCSFIVCKIAGP